MYALRDADFRPLTSAVTSAQVRAFRRRSLDADRGGARARRRRHNLLFAVICAAIIVAVCAFVAIRLGFDAGTAASAGGAARARFIAWGVVVLLVVGLGAAALILVRQELRRWQHRLRLDAFAHANGFGLVFESEAPDYPGALFHGGERPVARDRLRALTGRELELGRYAYVSRFGAAVSTREWTYVALRLDAPSPQIVLEARTHRGKLSTTGTPAAYRDLPATPLGGASGKLFTLYCPAARLEHARAILTRGLIDLLCDADGNGTGARSDDDRIIDLELVDDWMFLYAPAAWNLADPDVLRRLFHIVDTVTASLPPEAGPGESAERE
ncbi:MAG TPA: hypothetical protein VN133_07145 [Humibacter sp.]|nr:hypothetical protein [Humibacter sp.]